MDFQKRAILFSVATGLFLLTLAFPMQGTNFENEEANEKSENIWGYFWGTSADGETESWFDADTNDASDKGARAIHTLRAGFMFSLFACVAAIATTALMWTRQDKMIVMGANAGTVLFSFLAFVLFLGGWATFISAIKDMFEAVGVFGGVDVTVNGLVNASVFIAPLAIVGFAVVGFFNFKAEDFE